MENLEEKRMLLKREKEKECSMWKIGFLIFEIFQIIFLLFQKMCYLKIVLFKKKKELKNIKLKRTKKLKQTKKI